MFGLSFTHLIILGVLALIFIGPEQLPQLAKLLGKTITELKKAMGEVAVTAFDEAKNARPVEPVDQGKEQTGEKVEVAQFPLDSSNDEIKK